MSPPASCLIDDFGPVPVVRPDSVADVAAAVARAAADGQAVYPLGGRTLLDLGLPPTRPGVGLDVRGLDRVVDYPARDMTITVEAGITIARLQELLRAEGQRLPVDVPRADRATLGGALAANVSGPRRYGFGTLRDYLIGVTAINDQGRPVKAGGRVVKNVAGYDLCKLYIGSLGTLGVIVQATLKLRPLPEEQALVVVRGDGPAVGPLLDLVHGSRTRPVCIDLLNGAAARALDPQGGKLLPDAPWILIVGFEGNREAVGWQVQQLVKELPADAMRGVDARVGAPAGSLWQALTEFADRPAARLTFRVNLLPSAVARLCQQAAALAEGLLLHAHAGSGIVTGHAPGDLTPARAQAVLNTLHEVAAAAHGNVTVRRCPAPWKAVLPVWGAPRGDAALMRAVKEKLDPRRVFNPRRFVDGI